MAVKHNDNQVSASCVIIQVSDYVKSEWHHFWHLTSVTSACVCVCMYFKRNRINGLKHQPGRWNKTTGDPVCDEYQMLVFPDLCLVMCDALNLSRLILISSIRCPVWTVVSSQSHHRAT